MSKQEITFSNRTIIRVTLVVIATLLLTMLVGRLRHPITLIIVSFFLALSINPAVHRIVSWLPSRSRSRATGIAFVTVLLALVGFFSLVIPPLVKQTGEFITDLPQIVENFQNQDSGLARLFQRYELDKQIEQVVDDFTGSISNVQGPLVSLVNRIASNIASVLTVLILTFMMLLEGPMWLGKFWAIQNQSKVDHRKKIAYRMYQSVTGYVNGQLVIATISATFSLIIMLALGVPNAVALAGIVGVIGLIPMVGATISAILVVSITALTSVNLALIMGVYFVVYQLIENNVIQPYIQSRKNELTPLLVFIAALVGVGAAGFLGAFLAIPVASCIKILISDAYERKLHLK